MALSFSVSVLHVERVKWTEMLDQLGSVTVNKEFPGPLRRVPGCTDHRHPGLEFDKTRGWRSSKTWSPWNFVVGMKEVEERVSFFAVLSAGWPGVVICWSPRCQRPEVGPWLFVQPRWLPARAIWNDDSGPRWKMNRFPFDFYYFPDSKSSVSLC